MPSQAFHALALVAAARTAAHASRHIADRRAGHDASDQQTDRDATSLLSDAVRSLAVSLVRLRVRGAAAEPADPTAALVQAFEGRLVLDDVARAARLAHQALLSLYPAVDAETVEQARRLALDAEACATSDAPEAAGVTSNLAAWLDRFATAG